MRQRRGVWLIIAALATASFIGSLVVGRAFFENLSLNNDEAVYVLQAEMFAGGELVLSDSLHGDSFRPWMSGRVGGDRLVLVEQPTLVALMAASQRLFGTMRVALAAIAASAVVSVFVATRRLLGDDRVAVLAAACFTLSPLLIVQSAMFVSYVLSITLAAFAIATLTRAIDRVDDHPERWMLFGGGLLGLVLLTRPLEGMVLTLLIGPWFWLRSGTWRPALRALPLVAVGAVPIVALALLYNWRTTGDPLTFALWTIGGDDSFGFGYRAIAEYSRPIYVGPRESWLALRTNVRAFPHWLFAGVVSIPLAAWGAVLLRRRAPKVLWFVLALGLAYPVAYGFYYGNYLIIGGRNFYGPHYYLPMMLPAMVLLGVALDDLVRRPWPILVPVMIAIVVGMAIELGDKVEANRWVRDSIAEEVAAVEAAVVEPAVVLLPAGPDGPYVLHPRGAFRNGPRLDDPVLFAADLGGRNAELIQRFPDRSFYRFIERGTTRSRSTVEALRVVRGPNLRFRTAALGGPDAGSSARLQVKVGSHAYTCDATGAVTVELSSRSGRIDGCRPQPESFTLSGSATEVRFSAPRPRDPSAPATEVIWEVALPSESGQELATFSPPQIWASDGETRWATTAQDTPWIESSVDVVGRTD